MKNPKAHSAEKKMVRAMKMPNLTKNTMYPKKSTKPARNVVTLAESTEMPITTSAWRTRLKRVCSWLSRYALAR